MSLIWKHLFCSLTLEKVAQTLVTSFQLGLRWPWSNYVRARKRCSFHLPRRQTTCTHTLGSTGNLKYYSCPKTSANAHTQTSYIPCKPFFHDIVNAMPFQSQCTLKENVVRPHYQNITGQTGKSQSNVQKKKVAEVAGSANDACKSPFRTKPPVTSVPFTTKVIESEGEKKGRGGMEITG